MSRPKDSLKPQNLVFFNPSADELRFCSTSRDHRSQKFLRTDSQVKLKTAESPKGAYFDNYALTTEADILGSPGLRDYDGLQLDSRTVSSIKRSVSNQKATPKSVRGKHLPSLSKGSMREFEKLNTMASQDKSTINELIENVMTKDHKAELDKVYKSAREFQNLKVNFEKTQFSKDNERLKTAFNKLSEDRLSTSTNNFQAIRTDISHLLNEKRPKSPEKQKTLLEIKEGFKSKFTTMFQTVREDHNLSPDKEIGFSTDRTASTLVDNELKSSRFFSIEASPMRRNVVFTALHKDIRSVQNSKSVANNPSELLVTDQSPTLISASSPTYAKKSMASFDVSDDALVQLLKKDLPNALSSHPSNRQEVLYLGNWLIKAVKGVQQDGKMLIKDKFQKTNEIYNLCFNELVRQVSFDCIERAELIMKIWKAYMSLSEDIIESYKEKEKNTLAKANAECSKTRQLYEKLLAEKDEEIDTIKKELLNKTSMLEERDKRIERFNEEQAININATKVVKDALANLQKYYDSMKQEHKDVCFKYEKLRRRYQKSERPNVEGDSLREIESSVLVIESRSGTSLDEDDKMPFMFGMHHKVAAKEDRATSMTDLVEVIEPNEEKVEEIVAENKENEPEEDAPLKEEIGIQTDLALMNPRYDAMLSRGSVIEDILREQYAKSKLMSQYELIQNMRERGGSPDDEDDEQGDTSGHVQGYRLSYNVKDDTREESSATQNDSYARSRSYSKKKYKKKGSNRSKDHDTTPKSHSYTPKSKPKPKQKETKESKVKPEEYHSERLQSLNLDKLGMTSKARKDSSFMVLDKRISRKSLYNPYIPKDFVADLSPARKSSSEFEKSGSGVHLYEDTIEEENSDRESPDIPRTSTMKADNIIFNKKDNPKQITRKASARFEGLVTKMGQKPEVTLAPKPKRNRGVTISNNNSKEDSNGEFSPTTARKIDKIKNSHVKFTSSEISNQLVSPREFAASAQQKAEKSAFSHRPHEEIKQEDSIRQIESFNSFYEENKSNAMATPQNRSRKNSISLGPSPTKKKPDQRQRRGSRMPHEPSKFMTKNKSKPKDLEEDDIEPMLITHTKTGYTIKAKDLEPESPEPAPLITHSKTVHTLKIPGLATPKGLDGISSALHTPKLNSILLERDNSESEAERSDMSFSLSIRDRTKSTKTVASVAKTLKSLASRKKSQRKSFLLEAIADTLMKIDQENETVSSLIENQENKIATFTSMFKLEKRKQDELAIINRELEKQVEQDGKTIGDFHELVTELGQQTEFTELQKSKFGKLKENILARVKNLASIEKRKPKLEATSTTNAAALASRRRITMLGEGYGITRLLPSSQYKGDFMVDVVLSGGQKYLLGEKINDPGQAILAKIKGDMQSGKAKFKISLPLKSVLKQISMFYTDKISQSKENPMLREQAMGTFVYKQFINTYGFHKFGIQKYAKFIVSVKKYTSVSRVNTFAKMIGLLDTGRNYTSQQARQFLQGLEFIMTSATSGVGYANQDHQKVHYVPFSRAMDYIKAFTERYGHEEDLNQLRRELEGQRLVDPARTVVSGLLDTDIFLEKMMIRHKAIMNKYRDIHLTAYTAADFFKQNKIKFSDFLVLYKAIEGERVDEKKLEEVFIRYCDLLEDDIVSLSKDQFFILSFELRLFSVQKQNAYIEVKDDFDLERKYDQFQSGWMEEQTRINQLIEKKQPMISTEITTKWKKALQFIDQDMAKGDIYIKKSILIRHKIILNDITSNTAGGNNI